MQLFRKLERTREERARHSRPWRFCASCGRPLPQILYGRPCCDCASWATGHIRRHQAAVRRRWLKAVSA